ncbi:MAG: DUF4321 domain-containing protein [Acidaminococcaceae bacterium]|nr:DUF4321 domain-containing protein [Acidaminococcaceae bacterium]
MFRSRKGLTLFLFMVTGAVVGGLVGDMLQKTQFFGEGTKFLVEKYEVLMIPPAVFDFYVLKFTAGLDFSPNLVSILGLVIAFYLFERL